MGLFIGYALILFIHRIGVGGPVLDKNSHGVFIHLWCFASSGKLGRLVRLASSSQSMCGHLKRVFIANIVLSFHVSISDLKTWWWLGCGHFHRTFPVCSERLPGIPSPLVSSLQENSLLIKSSFLRKHPSASRLPNPPISSSSYLHRAPLPRSMISTQCISNESLSDNESISLPFCPLGTFIVLSGTRMCGTAACGQW